jgi:hypothetical protein
VWPVPKSSTEISYVAADDRAGVGAERLGHALHRALAGGRHLLRRRDGSEELRQLVGRPAGARDHLSAHPGDAGRERVLGNAWRHRLVVIGGIVTV